MFLVKERRIKPERIIVTTFTRKATIQLYQRAAQNIDKDAHKLHISTIDSLIWDIAQKAMNDDLLPRRTLLNEYAQRILLFLCVKNRFSNYKTEYTDSDGCKNNFFGLPRLSDLSEIELYCHNKFLGKTVQKDRYFENIYNDYKHLLAAQETTDYFYLSVALLKLLKRNKSFTRKLISQYDWILVDEFQDTSKIQAEILLLLAGSKRNIWVVGDPCQQIYEWRGAGSDNLSWFIKAAKAKPYYLTDNWRSSQTILDGAYCFLNNRAPYLKKEGMLAQLKARRKTFCNNIYTGTLPQAFIFIKHLLKQNQNISVGDIALLSRKLNKKSRQEIERLSQKYSINCQFNSSNSDLILTNNIDGLVAYWPAGKALKMFYKQNNIRKILKNSLQKRNFSELRELRPIASAADALDSILPENYYTFNYVWPVLKSIKDRETTVTTAVNRNKSAIQVMTIHAAKGLEFPVVILSKFGEGYQKSFPGPTHEGARLAYVGATRAKDILYLAHASIKIPTSVLSHFGNNLTIFSEDKNISLGHSISQMKDDATPPLIAASHLDLYEQCPLKFAVYHEGRFLPEWSIEQSIGVRLHKAIEYFLRKSMPEDQKSIDLCFKDGWLHGDAPERNIPENTATTMRQRYLEITDNIIKTTKKVLTIETRYRYLHQNVGQVEGVIDALVINDKGLTVLKEWKMQDEIGSTNLRSYEMQTRVSALAISSQGTYHIDCVDIVPLFKPSNVISIPFNKAFTKDTEFMLDTVFKSINDRKYTVRHGNHCEHCQLKSHCPSQ